MQATKLKQRAKEMRAGLEASSAHRETNWKAFECTVKVLVAAEALQEDSLEATALGQVAREINGENELWLAIVLSHASVQVSCWARNLNQKP